MDIPYFPQESTSYLSCNYPFSVSLSQEIVSFEPNLTQNLRKICAFMENSCIRLKAPFKKISKMIPLGSKDFLY